MKTKITIIFIFFAAGIATSLYFEATASQRRTRKIKDRGYTIIEERKRLLKKAWEWSSQEGHLYKTVFLHLVRRACDTKYPIPTEINTFLKEELNWNPKDPVMLRATSEVFELTDPEHIFTSDIRIKQ